MQKFLKAASLAFCSLLLLSACGPEQSTQSETSQQTYKWKMVTSWPKNFPGLGTAPENFAKLVEEMTNGRLKIKVFAARELFGALEVFDAVSQGRAQMGHTSAYYWKGKAPAAQFFATVPFGLNAQEMNGWLHYGGGMKLWEELYEPYNLIPLAAGNTGVQMGGWFNKEINSVEDLKGLKMRIPGIGGEVLQRAGGTPVNLPGGELLTALQTGAIDATEWVGPYNDQSFGLQKAAKYYYYPGWHEPGTVLELMINKQAFESLPKDLQAIVRVAARAVNQDMLDEYTARNSEALIKLKQNKDIELRPFPQEVLVSLKKHADEALVELANKDPQAKKVYDSYKAYKEQAINFSNITEKSYINSR